MIKEEITQRYAELVQQMQRLPLYVGPDQFTANVRVFWKQWAANALHLIEISFGRESTFSSEMKNAISLEDNNGVPWAAQAATGIFVAAQDNYNRGFATTLDQRISGEIFGDLVNSAKAALQEGHKDSAAVLVGAAFEDSLKRIAILHGLSVDNETLQNVVNLLKGQQILTGASGRIAGDFVKTRNAAMHAEWDRIAAEDVGGLIGFVQQVIVQHLT